MVISRARGTGGYECYVNEIGTPLGNAGHRHKCKRWHILDALGNTEQETMGREIARTSFGQHGLCNLVLY
jgi:hypothetical protein